MNVVVLGCGRVGSGLARELASRNIEITVVDQDPAALARLGQGFRGTKVLGSIMVRAVLQEAGVDRADGVAVVTGSDEVNAVVALAARRLLQVPTVVARLYDPRVAEISQRLGIRTLAPVTWGVQRIADLVTTSTLSPVTSLGSGQVELIDVVVPLLLDGRGVGELEVVGEITVVAVTHHGRTFVPNAATQLQGGDLAHVAVATASLGRLETLLGHRREVTTWRRP